MGAKAGLSFYFSSFKGLSSEVWWLALITLINRAGTMVIPFLTLYLTESREFTIAQVGWVMSAFGLGSICGSWLGGYLNDKIGSYTTMFFSLIGSGVLFILAQYPEPFWAICLTVFLVMLVADVFRPAMFSSLRAYSKPENQTRSLSLVRLAINLGFSVGPAVGGFLIYRAGYGSLFWVDGITCILAAVLLRYKLHPKKTVDQQNPEVLGEIQSAYKDRIFLIFCFGMFLFGMSFLQYFSTVPLYYRQVFKLSEEYIGLLLGFNGMLVFLIEMPLIHYLEKKNLNPITFTIIGIFLLLISFLVLNISGWLGWLWMGMIFMSFGEIFGFPYSNAFAMKRAKNGKMGQYMGLYSIAFAVSHVVGHNAGMQLISKLNYNKTWWFFIGICLLGILFFLFAYLRTIKEEKRLKIN